MRHFCHWLIPCLVLFCSTGLFSQDPQTPAPAPANTSQTPQELPTVEVTGKAENLLGVAPAASAGQADSVDLLSRPMLRKGELLEAVPGLIVTQHAGDGKANQYFLRGFNLDHGTDFATDIEGMPMNMRTHAHGQGYTDLNPLIPEMVDHLDYVKGTYDATNGDLSTAGSATFHYFDALPHNLATVEYGEHNYFRGLLAGTISLDANPTPILDGKDAKNPATQMVNDGGTIHQGLTMAMEYNYYDGPWTQPEHAARENVFLRYFNNYGDDKFSITFMGYHGSWISTDQVPQRAITEGLISRFGTLNPTDGGITQRYSVNLVWEHVDGDVTTKLNVYGFYYDLNLYSDFTYFLVDPVHGDQFNQEERREVVGGNLSRTWTNRTFFGKKAEYTIGFQTRNDFINPIALYNTEARQRLSTVTEDSVMESSIGLYADATVHWTSWFKTYAGVRADLFYMNVDANDPKNSGSEWPIIASPKFSAVFGPWKETELYLNWGLGFHSNDVRGVNTTEDAVAHTPISPATPLVRSQGAEIGIRTQAIPHLTSTLTGFYLKFNSELVYDPDIGQDVPGPPSERLGIEWSNYWRPNSWLSVDGELAITRARFLDEPEGENLIPQSVPLMFSSGINLGAQGDNDGWFSNLRVRAFGERPLEDNYIYDRPSVLLNGAIGYRHKAWEIAVECLNITNREDNDIEYYYTSRLPGEPAAGVNDVHLHPTEPREFRVRITYRF